jgi:hypothetical protein
MFSIYNNIRTPKVTAGNANMFQSMRTFDEDAQICPVRPNVSDTGTFGVARDTINTLAPGCNSSLDRVITENAVSRPKYFTYLSASAINNDVGDNTQVAPQYGESKEGNYDTFLGHQYTREVLPRSQMVKMSSVSKTGDSDKDDEKKVNCIMSRLFNTKDCNPYAS